MELMKTLSVKNNFHYHKDRTQKVETIKLTYNEEVRCCSIILSMNPSILTDELQRSVNT